MWKMFLFETAAITSRLTATRPTVAQRACRPRRSHSADGGHATSAGTTQLSGRGLGACGFRGTTAQPWASVCSRESKARDDRMAFGFAPCERDASVSAGARPTEPPPVPKQPSLSSRNETPARVTPSYAGPATSSVSAYASAVPPAVTSHGGRSQPRRAARVFASCTDWCVAAK